MILICRSGASADTGSEEAVVEGDLDDIVLRGAAGREDASHELTPVAQVVLGVADDGRRTGGAGGGVDSDDLAEREGEEIVGVPGAEVFLDSKG